ncbi:uncharacterized protein A4U43_C02F21950 [Asparagus officinalis]|uniref:Uncharacterized protein n=1 Tax=Asparagus officinalis TaxID=4686 RepID=A0A5P1FKT3_ASPOF|nr:uncharacterized protein A4U43_C02F21950 [Asparagus officinalis]
MKRRRFEEGRAFVAERAGESGREWRMTAVVVGAERCGGGGQAVGGGGGEEGGRGGGRRRGGGRAAGGGVGAGFRLNDGFVEREAGSRREGEARRREEGILGIPVFEEEERGWSLGSCGSGGGGFGRRPCLRGTSQGRPLATSEQRTRGGDSVGGRLGLPFPLDPLSSSSSGRRRSSPPPAARCGAAEILPSHRRRRRHGGPERARIDPMGHSSHSMELMSPFTTSRSSGAQGYTAARSPRVDRLGFIITRSFRPLTASP